MKIGDIVVRKSYGGDITFKIIDIVIRDDKDVFLLKGINLRIEADSTSEDLQLVSEEIIYEIDRVFNKKVNASIKKILINRVKGTRGDKSETIRF